MDDTTSSNLNKIIAAGDRVEFKSFIKDCSLPDLSTAWIRAAKSRVQDFSKLAITELNNRSRPNPKVDLRDSDPSREGIFRDHNCWKCKNGKLPCVSKMPSYCEYPHARND